MFFHSTKSSQGNDSKPSARAIAWSRVGASLPAESRHDQKNAPGTSPYDFQTSARSGSDSWRMKPPDSYHPGGNSSAIGHRSSTARMASRAVRNIGSSKRANHEDVPRTLYTVISGLWERVNRSSP